MQHWLWIAEMLDDLETDCRPNHLISAIINKRGQRERFIVKIKFKKIDIITIIMLFAILDTFLAALKCNNVIRAAIRQNG